MDKDNFLRCPVCNSVMVLRERYRDGRLFYGCPNYRSDGTGCNGTRSFEEGRGKKTVPSGYINNGNGGRCLRCDQYPIYGSLSAMGLCPGCQERIDND